MTMDASPTIRGLETNKRKAQLVNRVRRILGQVEAMERGIGHGNSCTDVLQLSSATRGALDALLSELIEQHLAESQHNGTIAEAAEELIVIVRSYLK
jgi:FrmR/RcnR family transcriptional regulator, repressor of frmRAB operon